MRKEPPLAIIQGDELETYAHNLKEFDYSSFEIEISGTCLPAKGKIPGGQADEWQDDITFVAIRPSLLEQSKEDL